MKQYLIIYFTKVTMKDHKDKYNPGWVAHMVRTPSRYAKVTGSIST